MLAYVPLYSIRHSAMVGAMNFTKKVTNMRQYLASLGGGLRGSGLHEACGPGERHRKALTLANRLEIGPVPTGRPRHRMPEGRRGLYHCKQCGRQAPSSTGIRSRTAVPPLLNRRKTNDVLRRLSLSEVTHRPVLAKTQHHLYLTASIVPNGALELARQTDRRVE